MGQLTQKQTYFSQPHLKVLLLPCTAQVRLPSLHSLLQFSVVVVPLLCIPHHWHSSFLYFQYQNIKPCLLPWWKTRPCKNMLTMSSSQNFFLKYHLFPSHSKSCSVGKSCPHVQALFINWEIVSPSSIKSHVSFVRALRKSAKFQTPSFEKCLL